MRRNDEGVPDFRYVATHICDSIKRQLKSGGAKGIQGEFGIGLLSFWTVGEALAMSACGADSAVHEMHMRKGDPGYEVTRRQVLAPEPGTRLKIGPLLPGVRQISGEKIQWYLASELRERIRHSGVDVKVMDRNARKEFSVEPREFTGDLLHHLPAVGEVYAELYLNPPDPANGAARAQGTPRHWNNTGNQLAARLSLSLGSSLSPGGRGLGRGGGVAHGEHQVVEAFDESRRIVELPSFGKQRLIEQDVAPVAEARPVGFVFQALHQRMMRVDLQNRLVAGHLLAGLLEHALEVGAHAVLLRN